MSIRYERMNEEIKKTISEIIKDMKDPRVSDMTTIMSVDVTNDLKQAKVLVSVYDKDDEVRRGTVEALNHGSGFITRELGKRMQLRALPKLNFKLDNSIDSHLVLHHNNCRVLYAVQKHIHSAAVSHPERNNQISLPRY